jgi:hypothetical protein
VLPMTLTSSSLDPPQLVIIWPVEEQSTFASAAAWNTNAVGLDCKSAIEPIMDHNIVHGSQSAVGVTCCSIIGGQDWIMDGDDERRPGSLGVGHGNPWRAPTFSHARRVAAGLPPPTAAS